MSATIKLNGKTAPLDAATVAELLDTLGLTATTRGIAIALNGAVVPRSVWMNTAVTAGDEIEVILAMSGG